MYIKSRRESLLNWMLTGSGVICIVLSLLIAHFIYFNEIFNIFLYSTPIKYLLILCAELFFINFFTGLNRSFIYRGIYREAVVSFEISLLMISGLIIVLFWLHALTDSRRLIMTYFFISFVVLDYVARSFMKYVLLSYFHL